MAPIPVALQTPSLQQQHQQQQPKQVQSQVPPAPRAQGQGAAASSSMAPTTSGWIGGPAAGVIPAAPPAPNRDGAEELPEELQHLCLPPPENNPGYPQSVLETKMPLYTKLPVRQLRQLLRHRGLVVDGARKTVIDRVRRYLRGEKIKKSPRPSSGAGKADGSSGGRSTPKKSAASGTGGAAQSSSRVAKVKAPSQRGRKAQSAAVSGGRGRGGSKAASGVLSLAVGGNLAMQHFPVCTRLADVQAASIGACAKPAIVPYPLTSGRVAELAWAVEDAASADVDDVWPGITADDQRGRLELSLQLHARRLQVQREREQANEKGAK